MGNSSADVVPPAQAGPDLSELADPAKAGADLLLIDDARRGFADIEAGRTQDADAAIAIAMLQAQRRADGSAIVPAALSCYHPYRS
jgi:hypothetical protein